MENLTPEDIARFWMQVKIDTSSKLKYTHNKCLGHCWIWQGSLFLSGYGRIGINNKTYRTHRLSYYLFNGTIAKDKFICHRCDKPICVNPHHLFEGTPKDNTFDMIRKGRKINPGKRTKKTKNFKIKNSSSQYHGVFYRKDNNKWRARYTLNYENFYIGQFDTELEAAEAYNSAVKEVNSSLKEKDRFILNVFGLP